MARRIHKEKPQDIWIAGHVFGDVVARDVTIGHDASVDGSIDGRSVVIHGRVLGAVKADRITLGPSAVVEGAMCYGELDVAAGASIVATCTAA